jgi:TolA-binding protein
MYSKNSLATSDTLINSYINFANSFPDHPYAIKYLFKAAHANILAKRNADAAKLYEQLANKYKDSALAAEALINAGFSYQALNDIVSEKRVFRQFLSQYPNHPRALDIQMSLEMLDFTPAQQDSIMMERIRKNNPGMQ